MVASIRCDRSLQPARRTINIQVGKKPLIVREGFEMDSPIIGQLVAGQLATVIEERIDENGNVRACVTIEEQLPNGFESARGELARSPRLGAHSIVPVPNGSKLSSLREDEVLQEDLGLSPQAGAPAPPTVIGRGWVTLGRRKKLVTSRVRLHWSATAAHASVEPPPAQRQAAECRQERARVRSDRHRLCLRRGLSRSDPCEGCIMRPTRYTFRLVWWGVTSST